MARKDDIVAPIAERITSSGITAQDISLMSGDRIPVTQAYDWLRGRKMSVVAALLLEIYLDRFSGKKVEKPTGQLTVKKVVTAKPIIATEKATSNTSGLPELQRGGMNMGRPSMTKKVCGIKGASYWLLYTSDYWYKLPFDMVDQEFAINGRAYCFNDFSE